MNSCSVGNEGRGIFRSFPRWLKDDVLRLLRLVLEAGGVVELLLIENTEFFRFFLGFHPLLVSQNAK